MNACNAPSHHPASLIRTILFGRRGVPISMIRGVLLYMLHSDTLHSNSNKLILFTWFQYITIHCHCICFRTTWMTRTYRGGWRTELSTITTTCGTETRESRPSRYWRTLRPVCWRRSRSISHDLCWRQWVYPRHPHTYYSLSLIYKLRRVL